MAVNHMRVEWKSVSMKLGELCAPIVGIMLMLEWSVHNLDIRH